MSTGLPPTATSSPIISAVPPLPAVALNPLLSLGVSGKLHHGSGSVWYHGVLCCDWLHCMLGGGMMPCLYLEGRCAAAGLGWLACCWLISCCTPIGGGTDVLGRLPLPQGFASVPLGLTSPSAVQTSFPVQLGGPQQVAAPPARPATGLVLSPDCRPIPAKLVERSLSGQFVEMWDFLMDNVKLVDRLESTGLQPGSTVRPRMHEVSSPLAWIHCFLAYAAIRCRDPFTRDMLAYTRLISGGGHVSWGIWMA